ncbi:unnamed protein product, partial [Rotaria sp. Silwood1]
MPWNYWNWVYCSVFISLSIVLITFFILVILLRYFDDVFFSAVAKLFNVERCIIDIHHQIIPNSTFNFSSAGKVKTTKSVSGILSFCGICTGEASDTSAGLILTTIIISAALTAVFGNIFLATTTVYRDGPCPNYGPMECYCGDNHTYFDCIVGEIVNCPVDFISGTCFRWIIRDVTTSDLTTQIGITAGLLTALGAIAECLIRLYLYVLNKRLGVSIGIARILAKTVGINTTTAPSP